jgi:hypothetical protein
MKPQDKSLLTIVYDSGMDDRVMEVLKTEGVLGWTKTFGGHGYGGQGLKIDTPVWPGNVNTLQLLLGVEEANAIAQALHNLKTTYRKNPGLTLWVQAVQTL